MVIHNVFELNSVTRAPAPASPGFLTRLMGAISRHFAYAWCGMHGHFILLHFEPNKLALQCALCGYESEGWEVGRPVVAHAHPHQVRQERRRTLRAVSSTGAARMAS